MNKLEVLKKFNSIEYKNNRQHKMSNYQNIVIDNCEKIFGKYYSWIKFSETLLNLELKDRNIFYVHTQIFPRHNDYGSMGVAISEILSYSSIKFFKNGTKIVESKTVKDNENVIETESKINDDEHLFIQCKFPASSWNVRKVCLDVNTRQFLNLTKFNMPARGSSNGPYPSTSGIFLDHDQAIEYRTWLAKLIHSNPEYFSFEGDNLYFSPKFPGLNSN